MYNFNHLYYFYVTAKSGGVTAGANHLKVSQPSLSSQLKVLEQSLDIKLFQKVGRQNRLTEAGLVIYGFCRQMFELSEQMGELISKRVPSATRRIHIGVSDDVDRPFVVEVVSQFLKKAGRTQRPKVTVVSDRHDQLVERLRFRDLDAVVTELPMADPELTNLEKAESPVVLTCSSRWRTSSRSRTKKLSGHLNHPLGATRELSGGDEAQWVMPSSKLKLRSEIDRFFEVNELRGRIVFESDVVSSLVRSVIDEIGLSFLPLLYIGREVREKAIHVLGPASGYWKYRLWLVCHKQNQNDELIRSLSQSFKAVSTRAIQGRAAT